MMFSQKNLATWIAKYGQDYLAHAVWANNAAKVLGSGELLSAECQLRRGNQVSHENLWYDKRREKEIPAGLIDQLRSEYDQGIWQAPFKIVPMTLSQLYFLALNDSRGNRVIDRGRLGAIRDDPRIQTLVIENQEYPLTRSCIIEDGKSKQIIEVGGLLWFEEDQEFFNKLSPRYPDMNSISGRFLLAIAVDQVLCEQGLGIDQIFSAIWGSCEYLCNDNALSLKILFEAMLEKLRNKFFLHTGCQENIRYLHKQIAWSYGELIVLCGDLKNKVSLCSLLYRIDDDDDEIEQQIPKFSQLRLDPDSGIEIHGIYPFENNGQPIAHSLASEDTMVIGPRAVLQAHAESLNARGIRFCAFEDMNHEQLDFFEVPSSLRPLEQVCRPASPVEEQLLREPSSISQAAGISAADISAEDISAAEEPGSLPQTSLETELKIYIKLRRAEASQKTKQYRHFYGRLFGYSAGDKIAAAEKLCSVTRNKSADFTAREIKILRQGNLGRLMARYSNTGLPEQFIVAEHSTAGCFSFLRGRRRNLG